LPFLQGLVGRSLEGKRRTSRKGKGKRGRKKREPPGGPHPRGKTVELRSVQWGGRRGRRTSPSEGGGKEEDGLGKGGREEIGCSDADSPVSFLAEQFPLGHATGREKKKRNG